MKRWLELPVRVAEDVSLDVGVALGDSVGDREPERLGLTVWLADIDKLSDCVREWVSVEDGDGVGLADCICDADGICDAVAGCDELAELLGVGS